MFRRGGEEEEKEEKEEKDDGVVEKVGQVGQVAQENLESIKKQVKRDSSTGNVAWVVQRYMTNPMLLAGNRKFDMRVWVLLDSSFNVYIHKEGVLRTSSLPFTTEKDSLKNRFIHLSNHCIQIHSKEYGKYEKTNEMFFKDYNAYLEQCYSVSKRRITQLNIPAPAIVHKVHDNNNNINNNINNNNNNNKEDMVMASIERDILPQIRNIVALTMYAGKNRMKAVIGQSYNSFHLFGYDFMITNQMIVKLIEINSSPAVANDLLNQMTKDVSDIAIQRYFMNGEIGDDNGFQLVGCEKWLKEMEVSREW